MKKIATVWLLLSAVSLIACYSFRGISIPPNVSTYYIPVFDIRAENAPPTIGQRFSEALKDKVRNESRLQWNDLNPDIEFTGSVAAFRVSPQAPRPGETVSFNRLEIAVQIQFVNHLDEKKNWKQTFTFFNDFETNLNLLDIQDQLIDNIFQQLTEDIFNKAFTDW
jgi:hypothetical protein